MPTQTRATKTAKTKTAKTKKKTKPAKKATKRTTASPSTTKKKAPAKKAAPLRSPPVVHPPLAARAVDDGTLTIASWNVNGLRAIAGKGFHGFLEAMRPDVLGLQETRASTDDLDEGLRAPPGYTSHFVGAEKKGYSGVGVYSRRPLDVVESSLDEAQFDVEARYLSVRLGALRVVNCYFPNGNGKLRDNSRIPYKLRFYERVFDAVELELLAGKPVLVMGDFNTAHEEIDLARPKENVGTSGFTPVERDELARWLSRGFVDTFRHFSPDPGRYSWWSSRFGVRARNVGWRIDYVLASPGAMPFVREAFIWDHVHGSDHCPVGVVVDEAIVRAG